MTINQIPHEGKYMHPITFDIELNDELYRPRRRKYLP